VNRKQAIFGFLNVLTGEWHFWLTLRKRSFDFLSCLQELYRLYPTGPILLFLDNASIHKSQVTVRWLANHPRCIVCYLPAYTGHQTNPVEKVWWALKDEQLANELYPSLEALQDAIYAFFATFSRERALRLTARRAPDPTVQTTAFALAA
jgi:transposase